MYKISFEILFKLPIDTRFGPLRRLAVQRLSHAKVLKH